MSRSSVVARVRALPAGWLLLCPRRLTWCGRSDESANGVGHLGTAWRHSCDGGMERLEVAWTCEPDERRVLLLGRETATDEVQRLLATGGGHLQQTNRQRGASGESATARWVRVGRLRLSARHSLGARQPATGRPTLSSVTFGAKRRCGCFQVEADNQRDNSSCSVGPDADGRKMNWNMTMFGPSERVAINFGGDARAAFQSSSSGCCLISIGQIYICCCGGSYSSWCLSPA